MAPSFLGSTGSLSPSNPSLIDLSIPSVVAHNLGQYSPYYSHTGEEYDVPRGCEVIYVHQLERHGSRYPTGGAYKDIAKTLRKIAKHLTETKDSNRHFDSDDEEDDEDEEEGRRDDEDQNKIVLEGHEHDLDPSLKWLRTWTSKKKKDDGGLRNKLGSNELVPYGQWEGYKSGWQFSQRYKDLFGSFEGTQVDVNQDFRRATPGQEQKFMPDSAPIENYCKPLETYFLPAKLCHWISSVFTLTSQQTKFGAIIQTTPSLHSRPFVRASGAERVVATARFFLDGFHRPLSSFRHAPPVSSAWPPSDRLSIRPPRTGQEMRPKPHRRVLDLPWPDVIISEARGRYASNNTLDVYTCKAFEEEHRDNSHSQGARKEAELVSKRSKVIKERLRHQLGRDKGGRSLRLTSKDVQSLANVCAFHTVASLDPYAFSNGPRRRQAENATSPFCDLFEPADFVRFVEPQFDVEKGYGYASLQPFHKSLAIGYLRELLARMQGEAPKIRPDPTSINKTLDLSPITFPIPDAEDGEMSKRRAFVDFTHDNQLAPIIAALGLSAFGGERESEGWKASATTPFAGRMTVEELECSVAEPRNRSRAIRILVNDAVMKPFQGSCQTTSLCSKEEFLEKVAWVMEDDEWAKCYL